MLEIVTLTVLTSLMLLLEFGPLRLVDLGAPALVCGPHWAGLMASLGFGGLLAAGSPSTDAAPSAASLP